MIDTYRCKIIKEHRNYFIGEDYSGNRYKIEKNENINCKVGSDIYFYAILKSGFFSTILIPVSDEEAGVI
ncbi:MAG: hypothetical protein SOY42_02150 [Clostridium sp.]|nr:hypothetical protein [Clostridium sp.]